ncbi:MAG TPA: four helix bundle protein [Chthoniobacterales bacterium]
MRQDLRARTKSYALRVIRLYRALPRRDAVAEVIGKQLLRSATSVAAHYREACRAKSKMDFVSKLEGALQELEESDLWLELLVDGGVLSAARVRPLRDETNELIAMFVTMTRKVKNQQRH